nr:eukaryotic translation initiation factor 4E-like [Lytechinus pictus]
MASVNIAKHVNLEDISKDGKGVKHLQQQEEDLHSDQQAVDPESLIKHPLQSRWSMWFFKNDKAKSWTENLRIVTAFDTVEDFWSLYNYIQVASRLASGCDYSLFKDGVKPMWEDDKNKDGGRWLIGFDRKSKPQDIDRCWLETMLLMIGESFDDDSDLVNGAVVNIRSKGNKIAMWTGDWRKEDSITNIGRKFKDRLGLPHKYTIGFEAHKDTMTKTGSMAKSLYTV